MIEKLFFILGLVNNLFLIFIFLIRKDKIVLPPGYSGGLWDFISYAGK